MISPRKSVSASSVISTRPKAMNRSSTKSCESLYSNSSKGSASNIYRQNIPSAMNGKGGCLRQPAIIPATNEVRQRVLSARRLRMKTYQNQLATAQQTIAELAHENRILRTLHKRQDSALSKYESTNAELPQLLHSHAEELRMWQTKYRNLQAVNKDLEQRLKQKESIILSLSDQNKYYIQLNKDKNLEDRQKLTEKLQSLEARLQEKDNDIKLMARKMQLESKQTKQQLQMEQRKNKELLMKLEKARLELSGFRKIEELQLQDKFNVNISRRHKHSNMEDHKEEKDLDKLAFHGIDTETLEDGSHSQRSQRSQQSSQTTTQRSDRTVKKMNINNINDSSLVLQQTKQSHAGKSIVALRRLDQGDGDASKISTPANHYASAAVTPLPLLDQSKTDTFSTEYEDDYENDEETEETPESEDEEHVENSKEELGDGDGRYMSNVDGRPVEDDLFEENVDYFKEQHRVEITNTGKKIRMKEEISSIRKQISDDYKEREAFLDTFCRQATSGALKEDIPKKRNSIAAEQHMVPSSRKHKLLAALKAIDDNKSQD